MILLVAAIVGLLSALGIRARREMPTMDQIPDAESAASSTTRASE